MPRPAWLRAWKRLQLLAAAVERKRYRMWRSRPEQYKGFEGGAWAYLLGTYRKGYHEGAMSSARERFMGRGGNGVIDAPLDSGWWGYQIHMRPIEALLFSYRRFEAESNQGVHHE